MTQRLTVWVREGSETQEVVYPGCEYVSVDAHWLCVHRKRRVTGIRADRVAAYELEDEPPCESFSSSPST